MAIEFQAQILAFSHGRNNHYLNIFFPMPIQEVKSLKEIKKKENKFYLGDDSERPDAALIFSLREGGIISIDSTFVSPALQGQGIGRRLIEKAVEYARRENMKIIPVCSYAKKILSEDEQYADILIIP